MHHTCKTLMSNDPLNGNFGKQQKHQNTSERGKNVKEEKRDQNHYLEKVLSLMWKVLLLKLDCKGS